MVVMLAARNLTIGYGRKVVGTGIDVSLQAGEVLALLGPNGGGKTTLLKTLLGLLPPLGGEVMLDGRPLGSFSIRERALRIAYVPQSHAGTFAFAVSEMVLMGRTAHRKMFEAPSSRDREIANDMVRRLGLTALAERPYTMISGGERQLVLIARALAQQPRAMIFDEPTANLDFGNQGKIMREVRAAAEAGLAILFTTHDPNQAQRYADRAVLLRDGRSVGDGPVREVLTRERLEALYDASVEEIADASGRAFLPA
jgi:iron complex transport system ATP-binding protein